jgi:hypothetical protein
MSGLSIIVLLAAAFCLAYFFLKKGSSEGKKIERTLPVDHAAQAVYNKKYQPEEKTLSMEEKIEKSWQFLADIRDYVINKFSKSDQDKVREAGHKMHNHGMKYQHDINDMGSVRQTGQAISKEVNKEKSQSVGR